MADKKFTPTATSGKAVADIAHLWVLKDRTGVTTIDTLINSTNWFDVLTLRGSVSAGQDAPSIDAIHVDQFDAPIGLTTEPGDFGFEAVLPNMFKDAIAQFLGATAISTATGTIDGKEVFGFDLDSVLYNLAAMIQTRTGDYIIFPSVQAALSFNKEDKVFGFRLSGQVIMPEEAQLKMIYLANEKKGTTQSGS